MGTILLGPTGSGKTTVWRILHRALSLAEKPVTAYHVSPKSLPKSKVCIECYLILYITITLKKKGYKVIRKHQIFCSYPFVNIF